MWPFWNGSTFILPQPGLIVCFLLITKRKLGRCLLLPSTLATPVRDFLLTQPFDLKSQMLTNELPESELYGGEYKTSKRDWYGKHSTYLEETLSKTFQLSSLMNMGSGPTLLILTSRVSIWSLNVSFWSASIITWFWGKEKRFSKQYFYIKKNSPFLLPPLSQGNKTFGLCLQLEFWLQIVDSFGK